MIFCMVTYLDLVYYAVKSQEIFRSQTTPTGLPAISLNIFSHSVKNIKIKLFFITTVGDAFQPHVRRFGQARDTLISFYKNQVYKNVRPKIVKNLRTC